MSEKTKLESNIDLLTNLINKLTEHNSDQISNLKIQFLIKLKTELENLQKKEIKNIKSLNNLIEFLQSLSKSIISNKENIDLNYLQNMFNYLLELEKLIDIKEHENNSKKYIKIDSSFLGAILHFFQKSDDKDLIDKVNEASNDIKKALENNGENSLSISNSQLQLLIIKLKLYFKSNESLDVQTLKDAILENLKFLDDKNFTINEVFQKHNQRTSQEIAKFRKKVYDNKGVEPKVLFEIDGYKLLNLITKEHLEQESAFSGHCVGTSDHYKNKIVSGVGEIFSLRNSEGKFCCTIEYSLKDKSILQIKGEEDNLITNEDSFSDILIKFLIKLCSGEKDKFGVSREVNSLSDIDNLIPSGSFLHKNGVSKIQNLENVNPEDILFGDFKQLEINFMLHKEYIGKSKGIFNLSNLSQYEKDLITEVKGSIIDKSTHVMYSKLKSVGGGLYARSATKINLNSLQSVGGDLDAHKSQ